MSQQFQHSSVSLKIVFQKRYTLPAWDRTPVLWFRSQLHYQLSQTLCSLMTTLAYTTAFCALLWMNTGKNIL